MATIFHNILSNGLDFKTLMCVSLIKLIYYANNFKNMSMLVGEILIY